MTAETIGWALALAGGAGAVVLDWYRRRTRPVLIPIRVRAGGRRTHPRRDAGS